MNLKLLGNNKNTSSIYTKPDCWSEPKKSNKTTKKKAVKPDAEEYVALIPNVVDERHINTVLNQLPRHIELEKANEAALKTRTPPNRSRPVSLISSSSSNDSEGKWPYKKQKFTKELEKDEKELIKLDNKRLVKLAKEANDAFEAMQKEFTILIEENEILQQAIRKREREDTSANDKDEIKN